MIKWIYNNSDCYHGRFRSGHRVKLFLRARDNGMSTDRGLPNTFKRLFTLFLYNLHNKCAYFITHTHNRVWIYLFIYPLSIGRNSWPIFFKIDTNHIFYGLDKFFAQKNSLFCYFLGEDSLRAQGVVILKNMFTHSNS